MVEVASSLRTHRIGGQLDPGWVLDADGRVWTDVRVVATLYHPTADQPYVDPTNGAHVHPLSTSTVIDADDTGGLWATPPLRPTVASDPADALQPTGLGWRVAVEVWRDGEWVCACVHEVTLDGTIDYEAGGDTITAFGEEVVDVNGLVPPPDTSPPPPPADEIGHGDTLPADGSASNTYEVDGSTDPDVPDGLYVFNDTANAWIQA